MVLFWEFFGGIIFVFYIGDLGLIFLCILIIIFSIYFGLGIMLGLKVIKVNDRIIKIYIFIVS